jgi:hypothetical protein
VDEDPAFDPGERDSPWSTGRVSGRCGCIAALLFGFPVAFAVFIGTAIGDCESASGDPCHQHDNRNLLIAMLIVCALAALLGLAVRTLVRWWRLRGTEAAPGAWSLAWALPVALLLGLLAIWCELAVLGVV